MGSRFGADSQVIRPDPLLKVYVAEKTTANRIVAAHRHPLPLPGDHNAQISPLFFSALLVQI